MKSFKNNNFGFMHRRTSTQNCSLIIFREITKLLRSSVNDFCSQARFENGADTYIQG